MTDSKIIIFSSGVVVGIILNYTNLFSIGIGVFIGYFLNNPQYFNQIEIN